MRARRRPVNGRLAERGRRRLRARLDALVAECEAEGVTVAFVEFCEDAETPGMLGYWAGLWLPSLRKIKVQTHRRTLAERVAILEHEMEHMRGAAWGTDHPHLGLRCGGSAGGFVLSSARPEEVAS